MFSFANRIKLISNCRIITSTISLLFLITTFPVQLETSLLAYAEGKSDDAATTRASSRALIDSVTSADPSLRLAFVNQSAEEMEYPKLHKCVDLGEAYSAAYLTTKEHLVKTNIDRNLTWVSCEMASSVMLSTAKRSQKIKLEQFRNNPKAEGIAIMSVDVLDFSILHLSAYERLNRKFKRILGEESDIGPVQWSSQYLKNISDATAATRSFSKRSLETVAVMPFLGVNMGAGHSVLSNRYEYLKGCFWSIYPIIPNIAVGVLSKEDADWARNSGLPFYDVMLLEDLPKSAALPLATLYEAKRRLVTRSVRSITSGPSVAGSPGDNELDKDVSASPWTPSRWSFKYMYYTESDQILVVRMLEQLYDHLDRYPRRMLLPHRLMPYPDKVVTKVHQREIDKDRDPQAWQRKSCCLPRQNCISRVDWVHVRSGSVPIVNIYNLQVPLGNSHFKIEQYRGCRIPISSQLLSVCP